MTDITATKRKIILKAAATYEGVLPWSFVLDMASRLQLKPDPIRMLLQGVGLTVLEPVPEPKAPKPDRKPEPYAAPEHLVNAILSGAHFKRLGLGDDDDLVVCKLSVFQRERALIRKLLKQQNILPADLID